MHKDYSLYPKIEKIAGWLTEPGALRSIDILDWQRTKGISGGLLEIGVFCGKYFALLMDSARQASDPVLGIDTFQYAPPDRVRKEMEGVFGTGAMTDSVTLWQRRSDSVRPEEIEAAIGQCRFVSIDGAHDYQSVYLDLVLAESVLSPSGIISVDDFLNPLTIGVNEAVNAFLSQPRRVEPVAYISNKLFLAHREIAEELRGAVETMFAKGGDALSKAFNARRKNGRHHIEQDFHGNRLIIG